MPQYHYSTFPLKANQWNKIETNLPMLDGDLMQSQDINKWFYATGYSTFNAAAVTSLDIAVWAYANQTAIYIDGLAFLSGYDIDPFINPDLFPGANANTGAYEDATSRGLYGVRVNHYNDSKINSFAQAGQVGTRLINALKDPIKTLRMQKKGHTWLRPHQYVTVNDPTLGITSEIWRLIHLQWTWRRNEPVKCNMTLVERYAKSPPVFTTAGEIPASPIIIPHFIMPPQTRPTGPRRG